MILIFVFYLFYHAHSGIISTLLITGQSSIYHNSTVSNAALFQILQNSGLFDVTVVTSPPQGQDMSSFVLDFSPFEVVILDYEGDEWPQKTKDAFVSFVINGGGVVSYHASDNSFPNWKEYNEILALGGWEGRNKSSGPYQYWQDGQIVIDNTSDYESGNHGSPHSFNLTSRQEHPISRGFSPVWTHPQDELYDYMRGPGKIDTLLYSAFADPEFGGSGRDEPLIFTVRYGEGRIFHTMLGHAGESLENNGPMQCAGFQITLLRGTEWAASGVVTQDVPTDFPTDAGVVWRKDYK